MYKQNSQTVEKLNFVKGFVFILFRSAKRVRPDLARKSLNRFERLRIMVIIHAIFAF